MVVRLRPNASYLVLVLVALGLVVLGAATGGAPGLAIAATGSVIVVVLGLPILASTVLRVPVMVVSDVGIRMPLLGVRLRWSEIAAVERVVRPNRRPDRGPGIPLLLVRPVRPAAVAAQVRPWLRVESRRNVTHYGTPIVIADLSLDHSLAQIEEAIARARTAAA